MGTVNPAPCNSLSKRVLSRERQRSVSFTLTEPSNGNAWDRPPPHRLGGRRPYIRARDALLPVLSTLTRGVSVRGGAVRSFASYSPGVNQLNVRIRMGGTARARHEF